MFGLEGLGSEGDDRNITVELVPSVCNPLSSCCPISCMNPLIRNVGFTWKGFSVPPFVLYEGEMIRIWIPMARYPAQEIGGHEFSKELQKIFLGKQEIAEAQIYTSFPFADDICQSKISYFIAPLSVGQYLLKKRKLSNPVAEKIMHELKLKAHDIILQLTYSKRKNLSLMAMMADEMCIAFDYYGLGPTSEEDLTELVREQVENRKSFIAFDNLDYFTQFEPYKFIKRIIVERV